MCKKDNTLGFAIGILVGILGGVAAGLLYAPKSGSESREEIKKTIVDLSEKYSPEIINAKKQAINVLKHSKCKIEAEYKKFTDSIKAEKLANAKNIETDVYNM